MFPESTRFLVVDDMKTMRQMTILCLKDLGFSDFIEAENGADAFEVLAASDPPVGVIISDWNMPNVTGLDFFKKTRESGSGFESVPFLMVTAEAQQEQVIQAVQAGVRYYIVKPFDKDAIHAKLLKMSEELA